MPATKNTRRPKVPSVVVAVVQPVTRRLSRIEDLLIEMRGVQDTQLKHIAALQKQLDELSERVDRSI
jgi:hypothetical protein